MFEGSLGNLITKLEETVYPPQLLKSKFEILFSWYQYTIEFVCWY